MNNKIIALILTWTLVLNGCGDDDKTSATNQKNPQEISNVVATPTQPDEPTFNRKQVLQDYGDTPLKVLDVSERSKDGRNSIAITLSVPLDPSQNHQKYFNISAVKKGTADGAWVISKSGKTVWFPYVDPDTSYDVTIYPGLKAANGQSFSSTKITQVKTSQLKPSVNFDTTGAFLTQGLGNGLPVMTVNVKEVDINFYQVREKDRQRFLQQMSNHRYYWGIDRITQFGDLAYSGRYELDAPKNTRVKRSIDIEGIIELKKPGIYLAVMTKAGSYDKHQMMWFSVTDIGLHARFYENQLDIYASSLKTGKALEQVDVSLVNDKGEILQQSLTSPLGQASFASNLKSASLIIAQSDKHFSVIEINKPALDLSDFDLGLRPSRPQELFIYASRDLYRPGEFVDFNALLRDADGRLTVKSILSASIKSPDGTKVKTFKWNGDKQNYYHYQWQIPASGQVGNWQLEVKNIGAKSFTFDFKVEEFLPERLKLTFNPSDTRERPVVAKQEAFKLAVLGEYLFGAPASGNRLSTEVSTSQWRRPVESLPKFEFGDIRQTEFNKRLKVEDTQLDSNGHGEINYKGEWSRLLSPLRIKFISSLYESGGRPVSRTHSGLVWPSEQMLGIRPSFGDKNPEANSKVSFEIVKSSLDGVKHKARNLDVKLIREDRRYFWVYSENQGWHYEWNDNEFVELTASLDINDGEIGQVEFPVSWGNYRLEVRDPTNNLLTSTQFYAGWNWYENWQNSQSGSGAARPDKIIMALDKEAYVANDNVKVNIIPPQAGEAIVMVEGNSLLWLKRLYIPAEGTIVEIPVSADWQQHNIYISAVVLQPGDKLKNLTPKRSFGLVHLPLQRESRKLNIEFDVVDKALPNKTLPVTVKVRNAIKESADGTNPQKLFVTLAAVDVGVLNISSFQTPDPFNAFFGQRRYDVDSRDVYNQVIEINQAERARLRFGGDNDLTRGGKEPQSDVQIISLFSGLVALDNSGEAIIPVDIPDFNGRLRLMALAFSADQFGHGEKDITIAAPVVTQIAMPRFLAMGDKTTIALDVTNLSGEDQELAVKLTASGPIKPLESNKKISLKNGTKTTLPYQIDALGFNGQATFSLLVSGKGLTDDIKREWSLGLRPPYPAMLTRTQKVLNQGESLVLNSKLIDSLHADTIQASVAISPKADIDLQSQLTHLLQYPYGCLEQTSSRAYPLIFATPNKQQLMGIKAISENKRLEMINKGIERLAMLQLSNGGYGLWNNTSNEEHWLTAYVADFLINARDMGINVPEEMLSKTLKRLQLYLSRSSQFHDERWSDDANHYHFSYKAYAAYVLARVNQAPLGSLRSLAKNHSRNARTGLSQTHLAIALFKMGDKKLGEKILADALDNLPKQRQQYLADYGSQIRDLALMIHLMLKHDQEKEKAIALSFTLAELLNQRKYLSTQERNALFLAGLSLKTFDSETWSAELIIGAAQTKLSQTSAYQSSLSTEALNNEVTITSNHTQPILAKISVSGYGKEPPIESSHGLSIQKQWLNLKGEEVQLKQAKVGELFLVHLQITAEQRTPDVLVIDLLPAGFELENQNLEHAIKLDEIKVDGKTILQWQKRNPTKHQEFRDDRYVAALEVHKGRAIHLFYLTRAVTPGVYKVPSPLVEDMYRPEIRGIGKTTSDITIAQ
ncbi:MAG: hypothetical protein ACJA1X_001109 [Bermanella sp.]|jgi:uncharacterized protein YfaS (alpha-2-macroglobulin family)